MTEPKNRAERSAAAAAAKKVSKSGTGEPQGEKTVMELIESSRKNPPKTDGKGNSPFDNIFLNFLTTGVEGVPVYEHSGMEFTPYCSDANHSLLPLACDDESPTAEMQRTNDMLLYTKHVEEAEAKQTLGDLLKGADDDHGFIVQAINGNGSKMLEYWNARKESQRTKLILDACPDIQ